MLYKKAMLSQGNCMTHDTVLSFFAKD